MVTQWCIGMLFTVLCLTAGACEGVQVGVESSAATATAPALVASPASEGPDAAPATAARSASPPATATVARRSATPSPAGATETSAPIATATASGEPAVFRPGEAAVTQTTVNIELVFDASGSMAEPLAGQAKIEAARTAMERVIAELPDSAPNLNVGFRVFGHKGGSSDAQRAESCQSTDLLVPVRGVDKEQLRRGVNAFQPTGWTPISLALQRAGDDLTAAENTRSAIVLVTDGEETCGGDPCAVARALRGSAAEVRIDVIGLGTSPAQDSRLRCIAENGGGVYGAAQSGDALGQRLTELVTGTVARSTLTIHTIGPDGPTRDVLVKVRDAQGKEVSLVDPVDERLSSEPPFADGRQRIEVAPGTYRIEVTTINTSPAQRDPMRTTLYTAEIAPGQNTDAVVGFGTLTVTSTDSSLREDGSGRWRDIELQKLDGGQWKETLTQRFYPGQPFRLTPGVYRLVYLAGSNPTVIVDAIAIAPGSPVQAEVRTP